MNYKSMLNAVRRMVFRGEAPTGDQLRAVSADRYNALERALLSRGFKRIPGSMDGVGGMTMVPPKDFDGDPGAVIAEALRDVNATFNAASDVALRPGLKPPTNQADVEADSLGWARWSKIMANIVVDGWAPCRFVNRIDIEDEIGWVFGIARGDFGVWTQSYSVCHHPQSDEADDRATFEPTSLLAAVTHLPSGLGMGIFHDRATACTAAELIQPTENWRALPQTDGSPESRTIWREAMRRANRVWEFHGIDWSLDWHAHASPGGPEIGIWTRKPLAAPGKKEKLS